MKIPFNLMSGVVGCLLVFAVQQASANSITYTLDTGNTGGGGISSLDPGPFGTVQVDWVNSTTANIGFTAGTGYAFVDGSSAAVNVNAANFSVSSIAGVNFEYHDTTSGNVSQFGTFNLIIDQKNSSPSDRASSISFTLTDISGTWADASDVLTPNALVNGYTVAAHIYVNSGGYTGYAGNGSPGVPSVPDGGATVLLLGVALSGLGLLRRKLS
jgi:VPDSG-CTERM motif